MFLKNAIFFTYLRIYKDKPTNDFISAVFQTTIDNVNKFAVDNMTTITALDSKSEYLFGTC